MSEVKRYDPEIATWGEYIRMGRDRDGDYVMYEDYESERLAHEETKAELADLKKVIKLEEEEYAILQDNYRELEKRLEELEDAITYRQRGDFTKQEKENGLEIYHKLTEADKIIDEAIANSRARKKL